MVNSNPFPTNTVQPAIARTALERFRGIPPNARLQFLQNHGGFSGANLWRVEGDGPTLCLRALPPVEDSNAHLSFVHDAMRQGRSAGLTFVPRLIPTTDGGTFLRYEDRYWELMDWMPGKADFHESASGARLAGACHALARLHQSWKPTVPTLAPCPAIHRRLERGRQWLDLVASGWRPTFGIAFDPVERPAQRAWRMVDQWIPTVAPSLVPWQKRLFPLQPCLCDIWHDHVLFEGDRVSGLIDYGGLKLDHVAVDLARLLGSMVADDTAMWNEGLRAYRDLYPLSDEEEELVHVLDCTGAVLALANWLKWLYYENRMYANRGEVARRLESLLTHVERWNGSPTAHCTVRGHI